MPYQVFAILVALLCVLLLIIRSAKRAYAKGYREEKAKNKARIDYCEQLRAEGKHEEALAEYEKLLAELKAR